MRPAPVKRGAVMRFTSMEELEAAIIAALTSTEGEAGTLILEQYRRASVLRRDFTGVGTNTYYEVPADTPGVPTYDNPIGRPVVIELEGLRHGAGAVMWLKEGRLDSLEVFTYDEPWPEPAVLKSIEG